MLREIRYEEPDQDDATQSISLVSPGRPMPEGGIGWRGGGLAVYDRGNLQGDYKIGEADISQLVTLGIVIRIEHYRGLVRRAYSVLGGQACSSVEVAGAIGVEW